MHDILEMQCRACGFSLRGIPEHQARRRACTLCGCLMAPRSNYSIPRRLPLGLGLLMGAFAASQDVSPLSAAEPVPSVGFARQQA